MKTSSAVMGGPDAASFGERRPKGGHGQSLPLPSPAGLYDFLNNQYVYLIVSARARGLSVGVNLNPDRACNFDCAYCEVNRQAPAGGPPPAVDVAMMAEEVERTLHYAQSQRLSDHPVLGTLPREFVQLRHVALSGLGEPTLCPNFVEVVQTLAHLRALGRLPYFNLVLITNGSQLDQPSVQGALKYFNHTDDVWIKLDAGSPEYFSTVNRTEVTLEKILGNILLVGRQRPVVIQSMFVAYGGEEPPAGEIERYALRLRELKSSGAQITLVQVYSAARTPQNPNCSHLPLKSLSRIAQIVRSATDLAVEVF
jgi:wyosine [tRNA(Phe)-imidazoG37] synthetase (radical SAM superfamily)